MRLIEQWEVSMTFRRIATLIGLAVALTGGVGLQAKTVTLGTADNRTDVSLNLGDTLVVELSSGDVNGFSWVLHLSKDSGLTAIGDDLLPAGKKAAAPVIKRFRRHVTGSYTRFTGGETHRARRRSPTPAGCCAVSGPAACTTSRSDRDGTSSMTIQGCPSSSTTS